MLVIAGILAILLAIGAVILVGSPVAMIVEASQAGTVGSLEVPLMEMYGAICIIVAFLVTVPAILTGLALRKFRPWARESAMVVCTLLLAIFPFGTALGIYGFWVVLSPEVEPLFSERPN